tara:strand:- start:111 stop:1400 length:1290 start_codon:yes stop_codon:yes gene_type:complete
MLDYIKRQQGQLEKKRQRAAELEAEEEAARVAIMEAEARKQEEIAARKKLLLEQQEAERLRQKSAQRKAKLREQKWNNQRNVLLTQINDQRQKDDKLKEIGFILQNREPALQELDWASWLLSDPLNQRLAALSLEEAMYMYKRDNLLAKRRHGPRGGKKHSYVLAFSGDTAADATEDYVATDFNPDDYNLNLGFTVSYWVKPDEVGVHMFAFGRKYSNNERFTFGVGRSNKIYIGVGSVKMEGTWGGNLDDNPSGLTAAELFPDLFTQPAEVASELITGNWLHFAVTYADRASTGEGKVPRKVYLNGKLIQEANINWSSTGGTFTDDGLYFGGRNLRTSGAAKYDNGWACVLGQVAIFDTAKDADWVASVYDADVEGTNFVGQSGLVGYWKFNDASGTTVKDYSGNGNHGTFGAISGDTTGEPTWEIRT